MKRDTKIIVIIIILLLGILLELSIYLYKIINYKNQIIYDIGNIDKKTNNINKDNIKNNIDDSYDISPGILTLNYPKIIIYSDRKVNEINEIFKEYNLLNKKYSGEYIVDSINIRNINGTNFRFFTKITNNTPFKNYYFEFEKYNDKDNFIFDNLKLIDLPINISIGINKLEGKNKSLVNTYKKISDIINKIVENNSGKGNLKYFTINCIDGNSEFIKDYILSKEELEIIGKMNIEQVSLGTDEANFGLNEGFKNNFTDDYIINFLKNTKIKSFYQLGNYYKQDGKIYKYINWKDVILIK